MSAQIPTLVAFGSPYLTELMLGLGEHGVRIYGGMYVPSDIREKYSVEHVARDFDTMLDAYAQFPPGAVCLVVEHENRSVVTVDGTAEAIWLQWQEQGDIKNFFIVDGVLHNAYCAGW